jgi:hypothetical protein
MISYDLHLAKSTLALAKRDGFNPGALVVPSAAGIPVSTGQTPAEYLAGVERLASYADDEATFAPSAEELAAA